MMIGRRALVWLLLVLSLATTSAVRAAPLNLASIRQWVDERNIDSVEELLSQLPTYYRSRFALVFASRSLQGASLENPRAILYGLDAKFILSFNGSAEERGFQSVEMLEFDDATKQFSLQELVFHPSADRTRRAEFSAINPEKCAGCHGKAARPVWDTHPYWPGAYGELYLEHPSAAEEAGFERFARQQSAHPRYRYLVGLDRFAYRYRFKPSPKEKYDAVHVEPPNGELTTLLSDLNLQNIAAAVMQHARFASYQFALLASLSRDCADIAEILPERFTPQAKERFRAYSNDVDAANQRQLDYKRNRAQPRSGGHRIASASSIDDAESLKKFRFVAEQTLGLDTREWTLALEKGSSDFTAPRSAMQDMERLLLNQIAATDANVKDLRIYESQSGNNKYCAHLWKQNRLSQTQAELGRQKAEDQTSVAGRQ